MTNNTDELLECELFSEMFRFVQAVALSPSGTTFKETAKELMQKLENTPRDVGPPPLAAGNRPATATPVGDDEITKTVSRIIHEELPLAGILTGMINRTADRVANALVVLQPRQDDALGVALEDIAKDAKGICMQYPHWYTHIPTAQAAYRIHESVKNLIARHRKGGADHISDPT